MPGVDLGGTRVRVRGDHPQFHPFAAGQEADVGDHGFEEGGEAGGGRADVPVPGFDQGDVEEIIDLPFHASGGGEAGFEERPVFRAQAVARFVEDEAAVGEEDADGPAEVVGGHAEELGLETVQFAQFGVGLLQLAREIVDVAI